MHITFTGGGTLGSVTPLLATVPALRDQDPTVRLSWIGTRTGPEERLVREAGLEFFAISSGKLRRYLAWRNFTDLFRILAGLGQSLRLLGRLRPDVVVSAGGFVAVPVVWAKFSSRISSSEIVPEITAASRPLAVAFAPLMLTVGSTP